MKISFREITSRNNDIDYREIEGNYLIIKLGIIREINYIHYDKFLLPKGIRPSYNNLIMDIDFTISKLYKEISRYKYKLVFSLPDSSVEGIREEWHVVANMSIFQYWWIKLCRKQFWITQLWFWKIVIPIIVGITGYFLSKIFSCH